METRATTVIETAADFTPAGKRTARIIKTRGQLGTGRQLRWYVAGKIYNRLSPSTENIQLTREWIAAN
jgi:hypothetical protein